MKATTRNTSHAASASANALDRALGYLNAALGELREAVACAEGARGGLDDDNERLVLDAVGEFLNDPDPLLGGASLIRIRSLRDRRASRAGFAFGDEGN
jgi:hypothetical protein